MDLVNELWGVDAQADWIPEDTQSHDDGRRRLKRYLTRVLDLLKAGLPQVTHCYIAVSGIESGGYTPIAAQGRDLEKISITPSSGQSTLAAKLLDSGNQIELFSNPHNDPAYRGDPLVREKLLIQLHSHEELVGFISLDSYSENAFSQSNIEELTRALPLLSRTVADGVFVTRLRELGAPFEANEGEQGLHELYREIVARTAHGFGADGSVLRIYDSKQGLLVAQEIHGDVPSGLLNPRRPGEGVSGKVFSSEDPAWALVMPDRQDAPNIVGIPLDLADQEFLRAAGARSSIIMRLTSQKIPLGTLSFFHARARRYSWRDIAIFKSYCQRVADTIRLQDTNITLTQTNENLRRQSLQMTWVEMVALLGHDLGHKTFEASASFEEYSTRTKKALAKDARTLALLEPIEAAVMTSLAGAGNNLRQIRTMYQGGLDYPTKDEAFSVNELVREVEATVAGALNRNRVELRVTLNKVLKLVGVRTVLSQALYNLVLNSVEAIRTSKKGSTIFIHGQEERQGDNRRVVITFWDDGPGINQRDFPNPQDVFLIGKTSKPYGTGTGLPVTRSLLSQYFNANLSLEDPRKALFRISIPVPGGL
jgi:signal transduction histidine kinase